MALAALDAGGGPRKIGAMNIGKVSKLTGLSARMIRHYEAQGILHSPRRRESGHRDYGAEEIRTLRFLNGEMSQAELGERLAVSRQAVNAIENGKHDPSLSLAFRIAKLFERRPALRPRRRQFGALTGAAALTACAGAEGVAGTPLAGIKERGVSFATADGTMDGILVQPAAGDHPAVILWPDIASIRESKRTIARKLASVLHRMWLDGTGFRFSKEVAAA